jgi:hypothetical protein
MLFYIEAKVNAKIAGISGPFQETYVKLVHAGNVHEAKFKFENHIRQVKAHTMPERLTFEYLKLGDELS